MTVRLGPAEVGSEVRRKRLWRAAARAKPFGRDQPFAVALEMLVDLAKYLGAFGAIGLAIGVVVATKYGVDRGAVPRFSGDEWLPQLASLGLFCGVFAMLLVTQPLLDSLARGSVPKTASQWQPLRPPAAGSPRLLGPVAVYLLEGLLLVSVVVFRPPGLVSYLPLMLGMPVVCALLDTVLAHWDATPQWWRAPGKWLPQSLMFFLTHVFYLLLLVLLMAVFAQKSARLTLEQISGAFSVLALALTAYRAFAYGAVAVLGVGRELVVGLVLFVAGVGVLASGEIVRATGLGNLPNAQLRLEVGSACAVAEHLQLAEWHLCLYHREGKTEETLVLLVDIVNRTGGHQVLAAPGMLRDKPAGRCAVGLLGPDAQARDFVCIEVGADAARAVVR